MWLDRASCHASFSPCFCQPVLCAVPIYHHTAYWLLQLSIARLKMRAGPECFQSEKAILQSSKYSRCKAIVTIKKTCCTGKSMALLTALGKVRPSPSLHYLSVQTPGRPSPYRFTDNILEQPIQHHKSGNVIAFMVPNSQMIPHCKSGHIWSANSKRVGFIDCCNWVRFRNCHWYIHWYQNT